MLRAQDEGERVRIWVAILGETQASVRWRRDKMR